jgi:hypothetical protein
VTDPGQASREGMIYGREVCFPKASRQGVIAALIAETDAGPLGGDVVESPGSFSLTRGR